MRARPTFPSSQARSTTPIWSSSDQVPCEFSTGAAPLESRDMSMAEVLTSSSSL